MVHTPSLSTCKLDFSSWIFHFEKLEFVTLGAPLLWSNSHTVILLVVLWQTSYCVAPSCAAPPNR